LTVSLHADRRPIHLAEGVFSMEWTKPEFTVVAVTMEVTAYAATK
jgi:coenzyme PQQ precursor peptide PqqA